MKEESGPVRGVPIPLHMARACEVSGNGNFSQNPNSLRGTPRVLECNYPAEGCCGTLDFGRTTDDGVKKNDPKISYREFSGGPQTKYTPENVGAEGTSKWRVRESFLCCDRRLQIHRDTQKVTFTTARPFSLSSTV